MPNTPEDLLWNYVAPRLEDVRHALTAMTRTETSYSHLPLLPKDLPLPEEQFGQLRGTESLCHQEDGEGFALNTPEDLMWNYVAPRLEDVRNALTRTATSSSYLPHASENVSVQEERFGQLYGTECLLREEEGFVPRTPEDLMWDYVAPRVEDMCSALTRMNCT